MLLHLDEKKSNTISDLMHAESIYCTTLMHRWHRNKNLGRTGRQTEEEARRKSKAREKNCQTVPEKEHPRVREETRKWDEREELGEDSRMRNG